ncbi:MULTISPECIES: glycosyltransferase family 4 protein [Methanosarcina]|uniref:Glycosyltransferase n=1 Tax=Methanosarcina vacuolata Z-761 TaxID=1434123 RepID=A0A0E3Q488_9EURY|nr:MULTISPECIES: glycosyltransferase family 4 protein [Methanosarcina]AKB43110.1 Glycosyltransferase [Methanosarcina vacuolata Z-761]AKB46583.1 Glycosyltransferase [Methanosarcina sp. Kolksee]
MKILQVIQFFSSNHGGSAVVPYELSKNLQKRGHEVTVLTTDFQLNNDFIDSLEGVEVIPFHCQLSIGGLLVSPSINKYLNENIAKFDIIHMHNFRTYQNIIVYKYAKKYNIPCILQAHGSVSRIVEKKSLKYIYDVSCGNRLLKSVSNVIAVSNVEVNQYLQMNVPLEKVVVIPNGIDIGSFSNLPKKGSFRAKYHINQKHMILYLGRLHERKGIDFLIRSFAELLTEMDNVILVLAGPDDGHLNKAKSIVEELSLNDKVKFTGFISSAEKLEAYMDADVLVYPSVLEIFGLVPFESITCGTPVIVTDDCGCGEFIKKANCGYLVTYGDIIDLKYKIRQILENPDIGSKFVENGNKYITNNLTWPLICKKIETLYEDCIHKK